METERRTTCIPAGVGNKIFDFFGLLDGTQPESEMKTAIVTQKIEVFRSINGETTLPTNLMHVIYQIILEMVLIT